ncbi:LPS ABC transporter substrate-binding protein LptA [Tianweitania sp. BSSL-BM11]|uniref:LPS ABC transporter substrate-binding protein LptA n=1 Tax=Tianweitania aestuarii TaxID=2814886 RepID=A0ABS5RQ54_9HYPH|nr:LPS ABC transporter substrate-binding protein LptA [Tianweitania aestuarii]
MNSLLVRFSVAALALVAAAGTGFAQQSQSRMTSLNLSNDQPIQIESDKLEVRDNDRQAIFTGNVSVVQGETLMKAGKMTVYYVGQAMARDGQQKPAETQPAAGATPGSADIERIEVDGKVYVKSESQVATGDRATFDMKSEVLTLTGKEVVLTEGENVIVGCRLNVQMKTGQAQLDGCGGTQSGGRVKMLLQPGSQNR